MKKTILVMTLTLVAISFNAQAFWGGNNDFFGGNNNGWGGNDWPVWTPMYWMDEMSGNDNYSDYYGNANPWSGAPMNNMPFNNNPWSNGLQNGAQFPPNGLQNGAQFPPNGYSPYMNSGPNMGYPQGYPQGYRPLSGYPTMPLAPSRGPTFIRP